MIWNIAWFEIRKGLRRISTYVYFLLFLSLAFLVVIAAGGAFPGANIVVGGSGGKTMVNSPFVLTTLISILSCFGMVVMSAIMGQAVYQDFHYQTHTLFFTAPISKLSYLGGRFVGALGLLCFIFSSLALGAFLGASMPFVDPSLFGPQRPYAYLHPYLITVIPNMVFIGAMFFSLAALARKILPVYVASVILLIGYLIAINLVREVDWKLAAALADPFGISAFGIATEYWTVAERNTNYIPLSGALLANRAIWLGLAAAIFGLALRRFQFEHGGTRTKTPPRPELLPTLVVPSMSVIAEPLPTTLVQEFQGLRLLPGSVWLNFKETVKNVYFFAIVLAGVLFMVFAAMNLGSLFGTTTYPITALVVEMAGGSFAMFLLIIITFYAGELVWRERDANMHQLYDVLPVPTWFPLVSKILALASVQVLLLAVVMVCGIGIQAYQHYFHFELGVYIRDLFGLKLISFVLLSILAIAVHVAVNHKYVGHFVMVLYYLATTFMGQFGYEHHLYDYAGTPGYTYSDMNGFGHFVVSVFWFDLYWAFGAMLLAIASNLLWVRGTDPAFASRISAARTRLTRPVCVWLALTSLAFVGTGVFIYYNTNILNKYTTSLQRQAESASYEKKYKQLEWASQPRITDVRVAFDVFPETRSLYAKGVLTLRNKTEQPVSTVYVNVQPEAIIRRLALGAVDHATLSDTVLGFHTFELPAPLEPNDTLPLEFEISYEGKGFRNDAEDTQIVYNGTFFNSQALPSIGYHASRELTDDSSRRKQQLSPRERMADAQDLRARGNNYISDDADWVSLDSVVSTSPDQIAIVPGYLQRQWTESGRRYFHYRTEGQILHFYSVLSGRYEVRRAPWRGKIAFGKEGFDPRGAIVAPEANGVSGIKSLSDAFAGSDQDVSIEIYFHRGHEYNVDRMIEAIQSSLDYFTANFGPYQHRQVRVIEFPRYANFAQSFPNTIPYSEGIGFIARVNPDSPDDVDYPYYVTAHEVAHQWWAHQVIGGNVRGSTLMSETFAQYSALMVMKHKFGADQMKRFLRYELDRYLIGRSTERKKELPLAFNENQGYIHYNKGSLVMYALQDYLGEQVVNQALASYIRKVGYQEPPYTNSLEFLVELRKVTPLEMQYLIEDMFETITLFDNRTLSATYVERAPGRFEVTVNVRANKLRADEQGVESDQPLDDLIDVGVLDDQARPLALERKRIQSSPATFTFEVDRQPAKAGIDPLNKLIDRRPSDNVIRVEKL